jgi:redox-sensitive bicupin YhaK (pirin superfamily)
MIRIRKANERGYFDHGWLKTHHTFSFGRYIDPQQMGFRALRVINEDRVSPGHGFGEHGHDNMEIVTYVLSGALAHRDSLGNGEVLRPGELQRMTAGTGIRHSEFNPSEFEPVHLYQIWLLPDQDGLEPGYEQKTFPEDQRQNQLRLVASPDAADGSLLIHQDARIFLGTLDAGRKLLYSTTAERYAWLQVLRGRLSVNGVALDTSDGAAISGESELALSATLDSEAELLLFDLN